MDRKESVKQTRKRLMLIDPDKAVAKKRQRKQEMGNDDRGFLFWTKLRVTTAETDDVTQMA